MTDIPLLSFRNLGHNIPTPGFSIVTEQELVDAVNALIVLTRDTTQREIVTADRTYYVNNVTGVDTNTGLSSSAPFRTINKAISKVCDDTYWLNATGTISVAKTGVNYDEWVVLRPWQGTSAYSLGGYYNAMTIISESAFTDTTYQTGVLIKPVGDNYPVSPPAAVVCKGAGARWVWWGMSVDGSGNPTYAQACYTVADQGSLVILSGDLGPGSDPNTEGVAQISVLNQGWLTWSSTGFSSHVHGPSTGGLANLITVLWNSTAIMNCPLIFDTDPQYGFAAYVRSNSYLSYYHQFGITGTATGSRLALTENSFFDTRATLANIPGSSWDLASIDNSCVLNASNALCPRYAFADLPTVVVEGAMLGINNCSTKTLGADADGAGAFHVPVYWTGTKWVVGGPYA